MDVALGSVLWTAQPGQWIPAGRIEQMIKELDRCVTVAASATLSEYDLTTEAQRQRRNRMLDAAIAIARTGGYDGTLMRVVARRANVAMGTLYRYFPSKVHLLVAALAREMERFEIRARLELAGVSDPYARMNWVIAFLTDEMRRRPLLTEAFARGFVQAGATGVAETVDAREQFSDMFASLAGGDRPAPRDHDMGKALADIWTTDVLGLTVGTLTIADLCSRLERSIASLRQCDPIASTGVSN